MTQANGGHMGFSVFVAANNSMLRESAARGPVVFQVIVNHPTHETHLQSHGK